MKQLGLLLILSLILTGCSAPAASADLAATTLPVYEFTSRLCQDTPLTVTRLVTEEVSCLHDYSLNVRQVKAADTADTILISGAGLEEFLEDILQDKPCIDASQEIELICPPESHHEDDHHENNHHHDHSHAQDPHIWLSPVCAGQMVCNLSNGLSQRYPQYAETFSRNREVLLKELEELQQYGEETLAALSSRELITFHDGFAYFAQAFSLTILEAVEEESGSEASARELIHLIEEVEHHQLPAIFTEVNGSVSAADIICRETGCKVYALDMAMTGTGYFDAMYRNIDTIKEALQ